MIAIRNALAALAVFVASIAPAWSTDFTDLWWNPSESGWGMNVAHQSDTMYITLYVYGSNNRATWFSVTALFTGSAPNGDLLYTGDLYEYTGPWFGGLFTPGTVTARRAGTATFRATSSDTANITYTVDNVTVSKDVERYTLKFMDFTGEYLGGIVQTNYNCTNAALNGKTEDAAFVSITQSGGDFQLVSTASRRTCTYHGTYGQAGRLASVSSGTVTCSDGTAGTFSAFELESSTSGFLARFFGNAAGCDYSGDMGGVYR